MKLSAILTALEDYLRPMMEAQGGVINVAETAEDAMQMLGGNAPLKWRVVLSTDGEKSPEDTGRGGHVVNEIIAYVQAPKGLEAKPGRGLHRKSTNDGPPFMDRLSWVIRKLRAVRFDGDEIDTQEGLNYRGWQWVKYQDIPTWRAAKVTFELLYVHDDPATDPDPDGDALVMLNAIVISGVSDDGGFYVLSSLGQPVGRVPRFVPDPADMGGNGTGYRITSIAPDGDFYVVSLSGIPDGRIPCFVL